jgi:hypothetical protein
MKYTNKEIESLPKRIHEEWISLNEYYSSKSKEQLWNDFKVEWDLDSDVVKEILEVVEAMNTEWKYWRRIKHSPSAGIQKEWSDFKQYWEYPSEETNIVFEEMKLLSYGLLCEWRRKYRYDYPYVYESDDYDQNKVDYTKSKSRLWSEFKRIWELDPSDYSEFEYEYMVDKIEKGKYDYHDWYDFRTDNNYHSYDSYSVRERYEIWTSFVANGCRPSYRK